MEKVLNSTSEGTIQVSFRDLQDINRMMHMTGNELYAQNKLKRGDKLFSQDMVFFDNHVLTVEVVIGDGYASPSIRVVLVNGDGKIVGDASNKYVGCELFGSFHVEDAFTGLLYTVNIEIARCAIPLCETDYMSQRVRTAYIDSAWLVEQFKDDGDSIFDFMDEYTSDESNSIIALADLNGAIAFITYDGDYEPFRRDTQPFQCDDDVAWKYKALTDMLANKLASKYPDAASLVKSLTNV